MTEPTNGSEPPPVSREALQEIYDKLREFYNSPHALHLMRRLTEDRVFQPPEVAQQRNDTLIQAALTVALPIAWRDWNPGERA